MSKIDFSSWRGAMDKIDKRVQIAAELALDEQAELLLKYSKEQVPKKSRILMMSARKDNIMKSTTLKEKRVSYNTPYAAYQHEGKRADGSHVVKNYTTPGTKKFYLKDPIEKSSGKFASLMVKNFKKLGF